MNDEPYIAEVASLIGDPARANMLTALIDGRALTASELAFIAGITPPTASSHLRRLVDAALVVPTKQGRHRYYRLAGAEVATALEALMVLSQNAKPRKRRTGPRDQAMRYARTCYNHLAGSLGVALTEALVEQGHLISDGETFGLSDSGAAFLDRFGVDIRAQRGKRRAFARPCLDWSERRPHLGGALGEALLSRLIEMNWLSRQEQGRTVTVLPDGRDGLHKVFGLPENALVAVS
ncbi:MAG: helix-turn-helix transcriptional regulator [Pseudomonadota bacterium]